MKHSMACRVALALGVMCATSAAEASLSNGHLSNNLSLGTLSIIASPVVGVAGSAQGGAAMSAGPVLLVTGVPLMVSGMVRNTNLVDVLFSAVGSVGKVSVTLSEQAVSAAGLSVGATVQVLAESSGTILVASGKVLAFVPNALGEALLHQQRLPTP